MRDVIDALLDDDSVLELRRGFGAGHRHRARPRRRPRRSASIANDPTHLGGAIDADGADKAARFMQLCDAFGLPVLFLCDTPGLHGRPRGRADRDRAPLRADVRDRRQPDACRSARSCCARATASARRRWPAAASRRRCSRVGWPTREFGGDGPRGRGAARACAASSRRSRTRPSASAPSTRPWPRPTSAGKGINMAAYGEIDDVIDPADTPPLDRDAVRRVHPAVVGQPGQAAPARSTPGSVRSAAARAGAAQQHVVALDPDPEPLRQAVDRPLEPGVVERHEPAALARTPGGDGGRRLASAGSNRACPSPTSTRSTSPCSTSRSSTR